MTLVYRHYDQATLDRECNPSLVIADPESYLVTYAEMSREVRERHGRWHTAAYGPGPLQTLDVFQPAASDSPVPVHVFFHGGGWRMLSKDESSFVVDGLAASGAIVIVVSYSLIPGVTLDGVVADALAVMRWVAAAAEGLGGDVSRVFISGHSAGAHLAAMVIAAEGDALPSGLVRAALLLSGNYELEPIRLSARNQILLLDEAMVARNSPTRLRPSARPRVIIAFGEGESGQYKEQARDLAEAWMQVGEGGDGGIDCTILEVPDLNHLEVVLQLADPQSLLVRTYLAACAQAGPRSTAASRR